jgi:guanine deaminase
MLDAMRQAVLASKVLGMTVETSGGPPTPPSNTTTPPLHRPFSVAEVFHLATLGGATCLRLDHVVGNFTPGKDLDMIVVHVDADESNVESHAHDTVEHLFEKFLFLGDDRNISHVFVRGRLIHTRRHHHRHHHDGY